MFLKTQKLVIDKISGKYELLPFYFETTQIESMSPYIADNDIEYTSIIFKSGFDCVVDNDIEALVLLLDIGMPFSIN